VNNVFIILYIHEMVLNTNNLVFELR